MYVCMCVVVWLYVWSVGVWVLDYLVDWLFCWWVWRGYREDNANPLVVPVFLSGRRVGLVVRTRSLRWLLARV
jgi:hypothetical protein